MLARLCPLLLVAQRLVQVQSQLPLLRRQQAEPQYCWVADLVKQSPLLLERRRQREMQRRPRQVQWHHQGHRRQRQLMKHKGIMISFSAKDSLPCGFQELVHRWLTEMNRSPVILFGHVRI